MVVFYIEEPTNLFCDNSAVVANTTTPESTLKMKHTSIVYHMPRETHAAGTVHITKEGALSNLVNMFKHLLAGPKLR